MKDTTTYSYWPLLVITWLFNLGSMLDKSTISFVLGVITSLLAIACYIIRIRQDLKPKK